MARRRLETGEERFDVAAAGGVVLRDDDEGARVAAVHRPAYDDWSLPKGKLEEGEDWLQAALREVEEETGLRCEAHHELPPVSYVDRDGNRKLVRYWVMRPLAGAFQPHPEVDELRWLPPDEAERTLSYEQDRELVRSALGAPG